ncbi:Hint domain-containing protein [Hasllibacter sp. MH4015]|uniref:Hint domain-containing protein n=1 Tax=Hasllibacter sp. MH4015 TaxID=2854029 RepID=UPI001CD2382A|nr:Hint domain-containing protein [Hasllibacter sp. MH4015]
MPNYTIIGYTTDAIVHDYNTSTISLPSDFNANEDRVRFEIIEGGTGRYLDGDYDNNEIGDDSNQDANVFDMDGNLLHSGQVYAESVDVYVAPDGTEIEVTRVEINGVHVGDLVNTPLEPGVVYTFSYSYNVGAPRSDDPNTSENEARPDTRTAYEDFQDVPCFVSGTRLMTQDGMQPVERIGVGDALWTLDRGWQKVRWRGLRPFEDHAGFPAPIEIRPGALGPGSPARRLRVSPQHRILLAHPACTLLFGAAEVFVAARHLLGWPGVSEVRPGGGDAYHHLLFERHEVLFCDGVATESLYLGDRTPLLRPGPPETLRRALADGHRQTARLCLTAREARALRPGRFAAPALADRPVPAARRRAHRAA